LGSCDLDRSARRLAESEKQKWTDVVAQPGVVMSLTEFDEPVIQSELDAPPIGHVRGKSRVYAIAFDLDIDALKRAYGDPYNNAYFEIRRVLTRHGFHCQQGSVYFGDDRINAVTCVLAAQDLARSLPWFAASVRDIRMLRIEEMNDLMDAVQGI
jgi:virulence-associated protein VapD